MQENLEFEKKKNFNENFILSAEKYTYQEYKQKSPFDINNILDKDQISMTISYSKKEESLDNIKNEFLKNNGLKPDKINITVLNKKNNTDIENNLYSSHSHDFMNPIIIEQNQADRKSHKVNLVSEIYIEQYKNIYNPKTIATLDTNDNSYSLNFKTDKINSLIFDSNKEQIIDNRESSYRSLSYSHSNEPKFDKSINTLLSQDKFDKVNSFNDNSFNNGSITMIHSDVKVSYDKKQINDKKNTEIPTNIKRNFNFNSINSEDKNYLTYSSAFEERIDNRLLTFDENYTSNKNENTENHDQKIDEKMITFENTNQDDVDDTNNSTEFNNILKSDKNYFSFDEKEVCKKNLFFNINPIDILNDKNKNDRFGNNSSNKKYKNIINLNQGHDLSFSSFNQTNNCHSKSKKGDFSKSKSVFLNTKSLGKKEIMDEKSKPLEEYNKPSPKSSVNLKVYHTNKKNHNISTKDHRDLLIELENTFKKEVCEIQIDILFRYLEKGNVFFSMIPGILNNTNPVNRYTVFKILIQNLHDWPEQENKFNSIICFLPTIHHKEAAEFIRRYSRNACCCSVY